MLNKMSEYISKMRRKFMKKYFPAKLSREDDTTLMEAMDEVKATKPNQAEIDQIKKPGGPL